MTNQDSISYLLRRVHDIGTRFGTLTDVQVIHMSEEIGLPELSERDIAIFRRVVETGVIANQRIRPPFGYRTLGFLITLKNEQERRMFAQIEAWNNAQVEMLTIMWAKKINALHGNLGAAKKEVAAMWGNITPMSETTRSIFNRSYELAKSQWETTNKK